MFERVDMKMWNRMGAFFHFTQRAKVLKGLI